MYNLFYEKKLFNERKNMKITKKQRGDDATPRNCLIQFTTE